MSTLEEVMLWTIATAGVLATALCSGMEIACYSINRVRLALRVGRNPPDVAARLIRRELDQPDRLLATLLLWMNIATYAGALATTELLEANIHSPAMVALVNTCVLAPVLFIFGEAGLPKELFRTEADRLAYLFACGRWRGWHAVQLDGVGAAAASGSGAGACDQRRCRGCLWERISDARQRISDAC